VGNNFLLQELKDRPFVIIYRGLDARDCLGITESLAQTGLKYFEVTMNTPGAIDTIKLLANEMGSEVHIGAGTVLTTDEVRQVAAVGGQFIISPNTNEAVIKTTKQLGMQSIPGAFTPTEIMNARAWGADMVKVFPINVVEAEYIKQLRGPFNDIPLMATGGVRLDMVHALFANGVDAIGLGVHLLGNEYLERRDWQGLQNKAKQFLAASGRVQ